MTQWIEFWLAKAIVSMAIFAAVLLLIAAVYGVLQFLIWFDARSNRRKVVRERKDK